MNKIFALCAAWLIACLSTFGSLYFSESLNVETCNLCWFQRICMYPLVIILGMAIYHQCFTIIPYVMPQVCIGCIAAIYQVTIQINPVLEVLSFCQTGPSCVEKIDIGMGPITLPMLSACACALVITCLCYAWNQSQEDKQLVYLKIK